MTTEDAGTDAGSGCPVDVTPSPGVVVTTTGALQSTPRGDVDAYLGVPYAAPPVGALRWKAPEPAACWSGVRPATAFGAECPQSQADGGVLGAEDCLFLNVFVKRGASAAPVLVWIHGGGNVQGAGSFPVYDGVELASRQGVMVVTFNYRLGGLGYFTSPGLDAESDAGVSGNYGLLDQHAVLRWVRDNAAAFGGDPTHVTLFGESAGGQDTLTNLFTPGSKGLFHAAIIESGGAYGTTLAQAEASMATLPAQLGCGTASDVVSCLRQVPASQWASLDVAVGPLDRGLVRFGPVIDGHVFPGDPWVLAAAGQQHGVPVIIGSNAEETSRMVPTVTTDAEYQAAVRALYPAGAANAALVQYPSSRFATPRAALIALTTDATWTCPVRRMARKLTSSQSAPVYRYFFSWHAPGVAGAVIGATHGLEVPFVFRTFSALGSNWTPTAGDLALSDAMGGYWSSFGRSIGTPSGTVSWPAFPAGGDVALELNTTIAPLTGVRTADCDFFDALNP